MEQIGPPLGNLLSLRFGNEWDEHLRHTSPEQIRYRSFVALSDFFTALARRQPLWLVLEDLHWADDLSLDLISHLMEQLQAVPLLLLCVYRHEQDHRCWRLATVARRKCPARFTELHLRELTLQQSEQMIASLLAVADLPQSVRVRIGERAQGNPFFMEEVVRSLIDAGMIEQIDGMWRARAETAEFTVPDSVQSVVLGRLDRLDSALKQTLQWAAVLGRLFARRVLAQVMPDVDLDETLWDLEEQGFVYQEQAVPETVYAFRHVLARDAVYAMLPRRRRESLHGQVATAIEALYANELEEQVEALAYHFDHSDETAKAVAYLLRAGEKARRAYLNEEAIRYFRRVLERLDTLPSNEQYQMRRLAALTGLGQTCTVTHKLADGERYLRDAVVMVPTLALSRQEQIAPYFWLGELLNIDGGRTEESMRIAQEGLALLEDAQDTVEAAMLTSVIAWGHHIAGNYAAMHEWTMRSTSFLQNLPYTEELRAMYGAVQYVYIMNGEPEQARKWREVYLAQARSHYDLRGWGEALATSAYNVTRFMGKIEEWQSKLAQAEKCFADAQYYRRIPEIPLVRSLGHLHTGNIADAETYAHQALHLAESINAEQIREIYFCLAILALAQNNLGEAERYARQMFQHSGDHPIMQAEAQILLGRTYLAQGRRMEGVHACEEALHLLACRNLTVLDHLFQWRLRPAVLDASSTLEAALQDGNRYRMLCREILADCGEELEAASGQWHLEPYKSLIESQVPVFQDSFTEVLAPGWNWLDPEGDCSYTVQDGLLLYAANMRDLYNVNTTAPRLVRPAAGNFTLQTKVDAFSADQPAIGGLLIWRDRQNFLCLNRGLRGPTEFSLEGRLAQQNFFGGRGHLFSASPNASITLRLERIGSTVRALCSADGETWFSVGRVEFPVDDSVNVGLYASGAIDRTVYPGAFPDGTAIRFDGVWLWSSA